MPIDAEKLLKFPVPEGRQEISPRDVALYALSVGVGFDPLDRDVLPYVDPLQGPLVLPSMVLVLAHPGFWMAHPDSGIDPGSILHAAQTFEILSDIPTEGLVRSRTRVTDLVDKGPSKAALVFTETELFGSDDAVFAKLGRTLFIRGGGGFGGTSEAPSTKAPAPGEGDPDFVVDLPTAPSQALLYRLNGDLNPLHSDPDVAAAANFPRPILHGLCTAGVATHAIVRTLGRYRPDSIRSMSLRFTQPVFPGETIRTEIWKGGQFRARLLERDAEVISGGFAEITPAS